MSSMLCKRTLSFVGKHGLFLANSESPQRTRCFACKNWSFAGELNILRASWELGVLWACSGFCWRPQGSTGKLGILQADFDFYERASCFAGGLNVLLASSLFCERTPGFAGKLQVFCAPCCLRTSSFAGAIKIRG